MTRVGRGLLVLMALAAAVAVPVLADDYLIYTDAGIPGGGSDVWVWCDGGPPCDFAQIGACDNPEGSIRFRYRTTGAWMGFGIFHNIDFGLPNPVDLSQFEGGELRFSVRTPFDAKVEMQCSVSGSTQTKTIVNALSTYGWDGSETWQEIVIPLGDFFAPQPVDMECLGAVLSPFMTTADGLPVTLSTWELDNIRWRAPNAHAGASDVQVQGRQFTVNGEPFVVNGMAYTPISIGEDWRGALRDRVDRYSIDFPLIAASGANTVRIYSTFLTTAMLDAAWAEGLYVIPTFPVDPNQLICDLGRGFMQDRFVDAVAQWKDHPAILAWLVGNEANVNLGSANLCTEWFPQLDRMAAAAHQAEGTGFHPVGTANAEVADICDSGCSDDTTLPNVDFWGTQIYRGCSFAGAFAEYEAKPDCARPLVVTEFGADSWDSMLNAENQAMQADCIESLLADAEQNLADGTSGVSAGQIVFAWADEWWKAFALDPPVAGFCGAADNTTWDGHDTCKSWESFGYPDPDQNEEWWGIASVDAGDPDSRGLRTSYERIQAAWQRGLGAVCSQTVDNHSSGGNTDISFSPGQGATDHTLYYGPLSAVPTYGYTGSVGGLGSSGSASVALPSGSLFWVIASQDGGEEGCYGVDSQGSERPCFPSPDACNLPPSSRAVCVCNP